MGVFPNSRHDIFISYAHADNVPLDEEPKGWITTFVENLKTCIRQRSGIRNLDLWMDYELRGNDLVTPTILDHLENSATLVLFLSPSYLQSVWCRRECAAFLKLVRKGLLPVSRIFVIKCEEVKSEEYPDYPSELTDLTGFRFLTDEEGGKRPRRLNQPPIFEDKRRYYECLIDLSDALANELEKLKSASSLAGDPPVARKFQGDPTVFRRSLGASPPAGGDAPSASASPALTHGNAPSRRAAGSDPLLYVLDRHNQEKKLQEAVRRHPDDKPGRPLICVVHGNELECYEAFLDRTHLHSLPATLKEWQSEEMRRVSIHAPHTMRLSLSELAPGGDWASVLWDDLARALGHRPGLSASRATVSRDDVISAVSRRKLAVIISATLPSEEMHLATPDRLELFFRFWNEEWPDLPRQLLLLVCLRIEYLSQHDSKKWPWWWWGRSVNDRLRRYVKRIDFSAYERLHCVSLPELRAISRDDAKEAAEHPNVRDCYDMQVHHVTDLYHKFYVTGRCTDGGCIPMLRLYEEFQKRRRDVWA